MSMPRRTRVFIWTLIPVFWFCAASAMRADAGNGLAKNGVLDLRSWNFAAQNKLTLDGEWDFYPGQMLGEAEVARNLLASGAAGSADVSGGASHRNSVPEDRTAAGRTERMVPDLWKGSDAGGKDGQGAGTYHLRVLLSPVHPALALRYRNTATAFELVVNGKLLASAGRPSNEKKRAIAGYKTGTVLIPDDAGGVIDIIIRVSNYEYRSGGLWRSMDIGERSQILWDKRAADILTYVEAALLGFLTLHCMMFFMHRRSDRSYLYLAYFCLTITFRVFVTGEYLITDLWPQMPFDVIVRLEYLTVALPIPFAALFMLKSFSVEGNEKLVRWMILPFVAEAVFILSQIPLPILTRSIFVFYIFAGISLYLLFTRFFFPAIKSKQKDVMFVLAGFVAMLLCFLHDGLYASFVLKGPPILGWGCLFCVIMEEEVLARSSSRALTESEALQKELELANNKLKLENERYRQTQSHLESALAEKELLLKEVHHRVKNSLQIISSTLTLQSHRSKDPASLAAYESIRERLRAISLVHERLYTLETGDSLDLGDYARELTSEIAGGYDTHDGKIQIKVDAATIQAGAQVCIDFGLVLTELLGNAFKYSIVPRGGGSIVVSLKYEGDYVVLKVDDDGPGFPPDFDPTKTKSLGYRLIVSIVTKYGGDLTVAPGPGGHVTARVGRGHMDAVEESGGSV